jgi:hypothetical protein
MDERHNFVTLEVWDKALLHFVSIHCAQKKQRAPLLGVDRNTVTRNCKARGVSWTEPPDRKAEVIEAPLWIAEMVQWMLSLRREDLPLKEPPAWMRRLCQASAPGDGLQARLNSSSTVTVNLDHHARGRGASSLE